MSPKSRVQTSASRNRRYYRPMIECLEDRTLPSTIFGNVWNDLIADGLRAAGEPPVAAVSVVAMDQNNVQHEAVTNGSGNYSFDLTPGLYTLAVALPAAAALTFPQGGSHSVQLGSQAVSGIDFGVQMAPVVPANIDVTTDPAVQQMPSVAVDPTDPNHVVMAYMDYGASTQHGAGYAGIGVRVSTDGGASWTSSSVLLPAGYDQAAGHPIVQFDAQGNVFISFMAAKFLGKDSDGELLNPAIIYDTTDTPIAAGPGFVDYLGKRISRRAFGMQANNGVFVARWDDVALSWNVSAVSAQRYDSTFTTGNIGIAAGTSATITPAQMPANLFLNKTLIIDEGLPSMERVRVTALTATTFTATFAKAHAAGFTISVPVYFDAIPDFAIDTYALLPDGNPNPNFGNLYATWTRFYPAGQFPGRAFVGGLPIVGGSEIMFAVSTNGGQSWTTRLQTAGSRIVSSVSDPFTGAGFLASPPFPAGTLGTGGSTATATEGAGTNTLSRVTVGPEGGVYVSQFGGGRFPIFYSTNAGVSFRSPVPGTGAITTAPGYPFGLDSDQYTSIYPAGAATQSFFQVAPLFNNTFRVQSVRSIVADPVRPGTVYAVEAVPILNTSGVTIDAGEITFSRSTDFGVTWTPMFTVGSNIGNLAELPPSLQFRYRAVLNDDNDTRFVGFDSTPEDEVISGQALPQLSVDAQGNIAVIWYDTRRDAGATLLDVYGTVSRDGGLTFSPNTRISSTNFDARNAANSYIGDRIGLALAGGKAYAAWTDMQAGNQDILFADYDLTATPFNDRFESNDAPLAATDLGTVTVQRLLTGLSLATGDHDWFRVKAGATGQLAILAVAPSSGSGLELELWDATGANRLATGTAVMDNGLVVGVKIDFQANSNQTYFVHVLGSGAPVYSLALQALTKDLGTLVHAAEDGSLATGAADVYRVVAASGGSLQVSLTSGSNVVGNLNLQVLTSDGKTILAQGLEPGTPGAGEVEQLTVAVAEGQEVLVKVLGATSASLARVSVSDVPVTLGLGTPGPAVNFTTPGAVGGARSVSLQVLGANPLNVKVTQRNAAGTILGTPQFKLLIPGTPVTVTLANTAGTYDIQAMDPVGLGSYHLDIANLDAFQTPDNNNLFYSTGQTSASVTAGDLNGDGRPDLVLTSTQSGDNVQVLIANADGTFQAARQYAVGAGQAAISNREPVLGDFNGDGILDIVVPNYFSADVSLLVGRGDGSFAPQRRFDANYKANSVASADFNHDGNPDLAVLNRTPGAATLSILMGRGDSTFVPPQNIEIPFARGDASPVRAGDLNGDGHTDLAVFSANDTQFQVLFGRGDGTFFLGGLFSAGEVLFDAQLADLNGDGKLDVVIGGGNSGSVIVRLGNGDGTFQDPQPYATAPRIGNDNIGVVGLAVVDYDGDGHVDVLVTTRYRSGSDVPQAFLLPGIAPDVNGRIFAPAVRLGTSHEAGKIAVADFDGDGFNDLAITEAGGVRVLYGQVPHIVPNTTLGTARDLGTVLHYLGQPQAIVPGFTDAFYTLQVPDQVIDEVVHQVVDISALFQNVEGDGLQMEVTGAIRIVESTADSTGARLRVLALHGATLTLHVSSKNGGFGTYTLDVNVLPQLISAQTLGALPGGPQTSIVLTLQGDRLDPDSAQDPANYTVRLLGPDGVTPVGPAIPLASAPGTRPVIYTPGANVQVSSGRTFPTTVRQTITLLMNAPLTEGASYLVELSPAIRTADLNPQEAGLLAHTGAFSGHSFVYFAGTQLRAGGSIAVTAVAQPESFDDLGAGTSFLTQTQNDLGAYLDFLLRNGDDPAITAAITNQLLARFTGAALDPNQNVPLLILWLDPVNIRAVDPNGSRTTFNMQNNTVTNSISRSFIEVGGAVEVVVIAAIPGTYTLNVSDVQATARGGAVLVDGGNVQTANLTDAMRGGETAFQFRFAEAAAQVTSGVLQIVSGESSASSIGLSLLQGSGNLANASDLASILVTSIIPPEVTISVLASLQNLGQAGTGVTEPATNEHAEIVARMLQSDVGRAFVRVAEILLPELPVQDLAPALVEAFFHSLAYRLLRSLRTHHGAQPASTPAGDAPAVPGPVPEEEQALRVPEEPDDQNADDAPHDAIRPREHQPAGKLAGLFLSAVLTVGAAYAASAGDKERRKKTPGAAEGAFRRS